MPINRTTLTSTRASSNPNSTVRNRQGYSIVRTIGVVGGLLCGARDIVDRAALHSLGEGRGHREMVDADTLILAEHVPEISPKRRLPGLLAEMPKGLDVAEFDKR